MNMRKKPNLIYVFADQLRYASCGYTGNSFAHTPNINKLASEGVNFCNAISGSPLCAPYRASLFTGKYSSSTGMVINELRMNPNHECFAHVLSKNDYKTAYIGKWHLWSNSSDHTKLENQFVPPGPYRLGFDGYWAAYNFWHHYYKAFYFRDEFKKIDVEGYEPDVQTDMAINYINEASKDKRPFALFLSYGTPHDPWMWENVPEEFAKFYRDVEFPYPPNYADGSAEYWHPRMNREWWNKNIKPNLRQFHQIYYAMVANLDWNVGRLLKAIKEAGISENTIFVFTSDHGEMFGAHGRIAKNIFYEEAIRVPFLIKWPNHIPAGIVTDVCLNAPDIMPTLLSLMRLPIPEGVEGMDLSHWALGKRGVEPEAAFMQGMGHTYLWIDGFEWRALRDKRYTYAIMRKDKSEYLFDNQLDPYQMRNLVDDPKYKDKLDYFRETLKRKMEQLNDTFESCTWYRDNWTKDRVILQSATLRTQIDD